MAVKGMAKTLWTDFPGLRNEPDPRLPSCARNEHKGARIPASCCRRR